MRGQLLFETFVAFTNDAAGRAYAADHGIEYPFPNDVIDVSIGTPQELRLTSSTVCTGIIRVGYREPLKDHSVACVKFEQALRTGPPIPVAVWRYRGRVIQLSELFRP